MMKLETETRKIAFLTACSAGGLGGTVSGADELFAFAGMTEVETPASDDDVFTVRLIPAGTFSDRDGRGPFQVGGKTEMAAIVTATEARLGETQMMIDYDHQSVFGAKNGVGGTARAAGWVQELEVRDDGIYGHVKWTAAAAAAIKAGEYRYISPVFRHLKKKGGKVVQLINAALVNAPALDLKAVAAAAELSTTGDTMDKIAELLGLDKGADETAVLSAVTGLVDGRKALVTALGVDDDADDTAVMAAVNTLATKSPASPDPTKYVPIDQVTALQSEVKALQDDRASDKAETAVAAAIEARKLAPALKDWGLALCKADPGAFDKFVEGAPALVTTQLGAKPAPGSDPALSDEDVVVMTQMGMTKDAFLAAKKDMH